MTHNRRYEDKDNLSGIEKLAIELREEGAWFVDLLVGIRAQWIDRGIPLTDILILENQEIMVSVVKAHVPYIDPKTSASVVVGAERIKRVVSTLIDVDPSTMTSPADFSLTVDGIGVWRGNVSVDNFGIGLSLRYLPSTPPALEDMNYPPFYVEHIEKMTERSKVRTPEGERDTFAVNETGLYLHVGPTSSGKTTSIAAEMYHLAMNSTGTMLSYEDPIEYRFENTRAPFRQFDIRENIIGDEPYTKAAEMIRVHLLRNNPTVVNMGEARRKEEILGMLDTALRGHLVYGTMHATNVAEALTTLFSVADNNGNLIASGVRGVVAHRLVTNEHGDILPLYEVFLMTEEIKKALSVRDDGLTLIKEAIERQKGQGGRGGYWSFNDSVKMHKEKGRLSLREAQKLME